MHRPIVFLRNPDNLAAIGHITAPTATYDAPARGWVFAPQKTRDVLPGRTELGWLGLEEAQRRKIDRILDIPADELKRSGVRTAAREKIAAVLTPRQAEDLDRHLSEHAVLRFEGAADTATSEFIPSLLKPEDIVRRAMELPENRSVKIDWAKGVTIRNIDTARFEKPREKSMTIRAARLVVAKVRDEPVGTLHDATFTYHVGPDGAREPARFHAAEATFVRGYRNQPRQIGWVLRDGLLRCRTDLDPENLSLRESSSWLQLMSWGELTRLFGLRRGPADPQGILFIKHTRFADFFDNIIMLLLTVPFILSRERNIKNSFGLAVLVGGTFYVSVYLCRYIGLDPVLGAWLPILVFGSAAPVMLHAVKT